MRRALFAIALVAAGCGEDGIAGPFDDLPLDGDFRLPPEAGLRYPVHVARDIYGIAHINAESLSDLAFVQGYVMAHDRLPQMDILRRFGAGTLSELFGRLDPKVIDTDLEMRVHRMKPFAQTTWNMLQASDRADDQQIVILLQRFADGVNAYAQQIRTEENTTGLWILHPDLLASFDPTRFVPWTPIDSLVLGRFQAFALSYSAPFEVDLTDIYQKLGATFDNAPGGAPPAIQARRGISKDLLRLAPVGKIPTIDGFPNVAVDTGSRSNAGIPTTNRPAPTPPTGPAAQRPTVPEDVLAEARQFFHRGLRTGPLGALGPHAFMHPHAGSNNWAVGPTRTGAQVALLATDQHLQLPNPSIFYPTHLSYVDPDYGGVGNIMGVTFPGIPGVILGTNGNVAWSGTVSEHDVNDVYLEQIVRCDDNVRDCVMFEGAKVPIQTFDETINVGILGTIVETFTARYEVVPHHGPIIPKIDETTHRIVPRTATTAMSVKYTGYEPTFEIRALWNLGRSYDINSAFAALDDFHYGSQNWTMIDSNLDIGWTTQAAVPVRDEAAMKWNIDNAATAASPFLVLPGDGTAEWTGLMSPRFIPHVVNPAPPHDYIATANADPVGATFDGDALNQKDAAGNTLYVGVTYAAGVREDRISEMIEQRGIGITADDMARIQHDTTSNVGEKLTPAIRAALRRVADPSSAPLDTRTYLTNLPAADRDRLEVARELLEGWTFATSTGGRSGSAATALFNVWMHFFLLRTFDDELTAIGWKLFDLDDNFIFRIVYALLTDPGSFVQSAQSGQPVLCDNMTTSGADESCTTVILQATVDAVTHLQTLFPMATATDWDWGKMHRLKIEPLFPNTALDLPKGGEPGYPKSGDMFAVNRSDTSWSSLDFSQSQDGPAQRFIAIAEKDTLGNARPIRVKWALPGGVIYDPSSRHYSDLLEDYYLREKHFDAAYVTEDILAIGESRWLFRNR